ncbi:hypothetical protein B0H10DRAFT_1811169 [Mycena sp. CBHHK59/15]|nr:hypothetical protein B0H10DRAFT_1811169 [Mycena sp. CBHHK59/15]
MSAAELKAQGNALFGAKNFAEAGKKYSKAIEASDEASDAKGLAVLYANRAACRLSLKRYMDAQSDAKKATELDPKYSKAFARLATAQDAMAQYWLSEHAWKSALDALPAAGLSAAEQAQKAQYEAAWQAARAAVERQKNTPMMGKDAIIITGEGRMPWDLAAAMLPSFRAQKNMRSSAWVIHHAYEDFMQGVRSINKLTVVDPTTGATTGLLGLTNGIMRDSRVVHFTDQDFLKKYNKQIIFEATARRAWMEGGPEVIIKSALERQRTEGWNATRPALSLTIRGWLMRGVIDAGARQKHDVAVEIFKRSLDVLRSLRESWILVPREDRGIIFEDSFLFGIQNMYLEALMQSMASNRNINAVGLEELYQESDRLIREVDDVLRTPRGDPVDPGFLGSFYLYPRGRGYAWVFFRFYYNQMSRLNPDQKHEFCRKAAQAYSKAADSYPEDDEQHPWFLNCAVGNMLTANSFPLRETLDVMKRIRLSAPKAKQIWERSSLSASGMWGILEGTGKQEDVLRNMVTQGKYTLNGCVGAS